MNERIVVNVWLRERATGYCAGWHELAVDDDMPDEEVERRIASYFRNLAAQHPDLEAIPRSDPRPPDPPTV